MARLDLVAPVSRRSTTATPFSGHLRLCLPGVLLFGFCIFGSVVLQAQEQQAPAQQEQSQQAQDQDVARAAREERARKQAYPRKSRHVYTAEDLKRDKILTPEDRALVEAKKNQQAPLGAQPAQDALDAQTLPPDAPLGDVARSFERQKELMRLRRSLELRRALPEAPVFAAPKPPAQPLRPPTAIIEPIRPREVIGPFHPPVKRSPFERPRTLPPALNSPRELPSAVPHALVAPATPEKPRVFRATPSVPRISPAKPKTPRSAVRVPEMPQAVAPEPIASQGAPGALKAPRNFVPAAPGRTARKISRAIIPAPITTPALEAPRTMAVAPVQPAAPARPVIPAVPPAVAPLVPAAPSVDTHAARAARVVTILPGDSLWKIAEQHLGNGLRWQELLSVNPGISNPNHVVAGTQIVLPDSPLAQRQGSYTVEKGDSLWSIAQAHLGRATAWSCIAKANQGIADANLIREGQVLILPASCPR